MPRPLENLPAFDAGGPMLPAGSKEKNPGGKPSDRETRPADKIGFREKMALGSGYLAIFYGNSGVKSLAIPVYQMVLGEWEPGGSWPPSWRFPGFGTP